VKTRNPVEKILCCALRVHADSGLFPRKILLRPRSCYKLKEIFMDKKIPFTNYRLCFLKTRPFEPFNLIGKVELMTMYMELNPIFVYAQIISMAYISQ